MNRIFADLLRESYPNAGPLPPAALLHKMPLFAMPILAALGLVVHAPARSPLPLRSTSATMTGETGLPLAPARVWQLVGRDYDEITARYWQALVIAFSADGSATFGGKGIETKASQDRAFAAAQKEPQLLNPLVADRFSFAATKRALAKTLGSESAAIALMRKNPKVLLDPSSLDGKSAAQIEAAANQRQLSAMLLAPGPLLLLLGTAGVVVSGGDPQALLVMGGF